MRTKMDWRIWDPNEEGKISRLGLILMNNALASNPVPVAYHSLRLTDEEKSGLFSEYYAAKQNIGRFDNGNRCHYSHAFRTIVGPAGVIHNIEPQINGLYIYGISLANIIAHWFKDWYDERYSPHPIEQSGPYDIACIGSTDHSLLELCGAFRISPKSLSILLGSKTILCPHLDSDEYGNIAPLPIGYYEHDTSILKAAISKSPTLLDKDRKNKVLVAMRVTNPRREEFVDFAKRNHNIFDVNTNVLSSEDYYKALAEYRFILTLPGYGLDSYRLWEAKALGCIPISPRVYPYRYFVDERYLFDEKDEILEIVRVSENSRNATVVSEEDSSVYSFMGNEVIIKNCDILNYLQSF